jgi:sulfur carrier protein
MISTETTELEPTFLVNGERRFLAEFPTVARLLDDLRVRELKGVAVALNGAVVPRAEWPARALSQDDRVLVIRATQGG